MGTTAHGEPFVAVLRLKEGASVFESAEDLVEAAFPEPGLAAFEGQLCRSAGKVRTGDFEVARVENGVLEAAPRRNARG